MRPSETPSPDTQRPPEQVSPVRLVAGLRACAEETLARREAATLRRLAASLESGDDVESALASDRHAPHYLRTLIAAGVRTGNIAKVLEEYLHTTRVSRAAWRAVFLSILYPVVMILFAFGVLTFFLTFAMPQFKEIFNDFGVELPSLTVAMIGISESLVGIVGSFVLFLVALLLLYGAHVVLPGRGWRIRLLQAIPLLGTANRMAAAAEFCSRLSVLIECRIPLDEALFVLSSSLRDPNLATVSRQLSARISRGGDDQ